MANEVLSILLVSLVAGLPNNFKQAYLALLLHAQGAAEENLVLEVVFQILILLSETLVRVVRLGYVALLFNRFLEHFSELFEFLKRALRL